MGRKRKDSAERPPDGQVNVKLTGRLWQRFEAVREALGLDAANFVRMIISENLRVYEQRAREADQQGDPE